MKAPERTFTNLELIERISNWPAYSKDPEAYRRHMQNYYYFLVPRPGAPENEPPLGYVHKSTLNSIIWPSFWAIDHSRRTLSLVVPPSETNDFATRTHLVETTLRAAHETAALPELRLWKNEAFALVDASGDAVLNMDACGSYVFGSRGYGVHLIAWRNTPEGKLFLVPRRSATKSSYAGMLDNSVGGSLRSGELPIDGMVREAEEEILLPPEFSRRHLRSVGTTTYACDFNSLLNPGCLLGTLYLYDLEMGSDAPPVAIGDGEVGEILWMRLDEIKERLRRGEFKYNCALVWLSWLIRHGELTADEDRSEYDEINQRLQRRLDLWICE